MPGIRVLVARWGLRPDSNFSKRWRCRLDNRVKANLVTGLRVIAEKVFESPGEARVLGRLIVESLLDLRSVIEVRRQDDIVQKSTRERRRVRLVANHEVSHEVTAGAIRADQGVTMIVVDTPEVQAVMTAAAIPAAHDEMIVVDILEAQVAMTVVDIPEVQVVMIAVAILEAQIAMTVVDIPEVQVVMIAVAIHVARVVMIAVAIHEAHDEMIVADLLNADESITMVRLSTATSLWNAA
jgi:hypothetical protein